MILDCKNLNGEAKRLSEFLKSKVISQEEAIDEICNGSQKYFVGLNNPKKPLFNFLFAGPTGTGKTKIVQEIGNYFEVNPVVINCGEMQQHHELAKLLGAPPGYVGHGETKPLLSKERIEIKGKPNVVLFDEIEKATPTLFNMLLGILDNGYVTTNSNVDVSFTNCFVFMTCNIGVRQIEAEEKRMGFTRNVLSVQERESITIREIKKTFLPEFINRVDKIVVFEQLKREDVENIFELELSEIQNRLSECEMKHVFLSVSKLAKEKVVDAGYSVEYGARNLKRVLEKELVQPVATALSLEEVEDGDFIVMDWNEESEFYFKKQPYVRGKGNKMSILMNEIL